MPWSMLQKIVEQIHYSILNGFFYWELYGESKWLHSSKPRNRTNLKSIFEKKKLVCVIHPPFCDTFCMERYFLKENYKKKLKFLSKSPKHSNFRIFTNNREHLFLASSRRSPAKQESNKEGEKERNQYC